MLIPVSCLHYKGTQPQTQVLLAGSQTADCRSQSLCLQIRGTTRRCPFISTLIIYRHKEAPHEKRKDHTRRQHF